MATWCIARTVLSIFRPLIFVRRGGNGPPTSFKNELFLYRLSLGSFQANIIAFVRKGIGGYGKRCVKGCNLCKTIFIYYVKWKA